jgi:WD domain, G-beta repeat.
LKILNRENKDPHFTLPNAHSAEILAMCLSPDELYLVTGGADKRFRIFNYENGETLTPDFMSKELSGNDISQI